MKLPPNEQIEHLPLSRFMPEKAISTVEQECFSPYEHGRVFAEFLANFTSLFPEKLQRTVQQFFPQLGHRQSDLHHHLRPSRTSNF